MCLTKSLTISTYMPLSILMLLKQHCSHVFFCFKMRSCRDDSVESVSPSSTGSLVSIISPLITVSCCLAFLFFCSCHFDSVSLLSVPLFRRAPVTKDLAMEISSPLQSSNFLSINNITFPSRLLPTYRDRSSANPRLLNPGAPCTLCVIPVASRPRWWVCQKIIFCFLTLIKLRHIVCLLLVANNSRNYGR